MAAAIEIPVGKWPGNCHGIAMAMLERKLVQGELCYGNWWGPIAEGTLFAPRNIAPHHGWIEQDGGIIVDPTRWVFEGSEPYIFQGPDPENYYDFGGNRLRASFRKPPPEWDENARKIWEEAYLPSFLIQILLNFFPWQTGYTRDQIFWMANLSPEELQPFTRDFYEWLREEGLAGYVPLDNMQRVTSPRWPGAELE